MTIPYHLLNDRDLAAYLKMFEVKILLYLDWHNADPNIFLLNGRNFVASQHHQIQVLSL
jgi:hypothetical protein